MPLEPARALATAAAFVKAHEGCKLKTHRDLKRTWAIGYTATTMAPRSPSPSGQIFAR
jgi:GH24 family phage-related lysozyme (muramidase)